LHLSTSALLEDTGTVLGVSGIVDGLIWGTGITRAPKSQDHESTREKEDAQWVERYRRMALVGGMIAAPITASMLSVGGQGAIDTVRSWDILSGQLGWDRLALAGVLVGLGSRVSRLHCSLIAFVQSADSAAWIWLYKVLSSFCHVM
jgi:hypothetical protein